MRSPIRVTLRILLHPRRSLNPPRYKIVPPRTRKRKLTLGPQPSAALENGENDPVYLGLPKFSPLLEDFKFESSGETIDEPIKKKNPKLILDIKPDLSILRNPRTTLLSTPTSCLSSRRKSRFDFVPSLQAIKEDLWKQTSSTQFSNTVWNPPLAILWKARQASAKASRGKTHTSRATTYIPFKMAVATVGTTYFLPPSAQLDSFFDGTGSAKDFVKRFDLLAMSYGWKEADKLKYFPHYLKDSAKAWYDMHREGLAKNQGVDYAEAVLD